MTTPKPPNTRDPNQLTNGSNDPDDVGVSERPLVTSRSISVNDVAAELGDLEFNPDDVLASLEAYEEPSTVVESVTPHVSFVDERSAHSHLQELGLIEEFRGITNRLDSEYTSSNATLGKPELAIINSEIFAILGDTSTALSHASRAISALPTSRLTCLQVRHLAVDCGHLDDIHSLVSDEIASLPDATSKAHLHLWLTEFMRLVIGDKRASAEALTRALSECPSDGQVALLRMRGELANGETTYLGWLSSHPSPVASTDSIRTLARLRGDILEHNPDISHPAALILDVAVALSAGDLSNASLWLNGLTSLPDFELSIRWLRACLMAATEGTRKNAIGELLKLDELEYDPEVLLALLERSVEVNDAELTRSLLDTVETNEKRISAADELVLSVLASRTPPKIQALCEVVAKDPSLNALAVAACGLTDPESSEIAGSNPQTLYDLVMARWIASASPTASLSFPRLGQSPGNSDEFLALKFALELEEARERRDWGKIAQLFQKAHTDSGPWLPGDRESLAALCFEAGGDSASAQVAWQLARAATSSREAAVRADLEFSASDHKQAILEEYADQLDLQDERVPWLLLEAALLAQATNASDAQRLLEHAHAMCPDLTLTMTMGEDLARLSERTNAAVNWLGKRGELADDPAESALLAAEEALLLMDHDAISAETCAIRAIEFAPDERTLREFRCQLAPSSSEWQSRHAPAPPDESGFEYLCQSVARLAWVGDWSAASDAALALTEINAPTVAALWAEQAAAGGQRSPKLFERLFAQARTETDPVAQRELYERLARIDPNIGSEGTVDLWLNAIVEREPNNLPALRGLERSVIRRGRWLELASISEKLVQQLDRNEALAYAWLSSTLHTYTGNWAAGEHLIEWAGRQEPVPLWSLRRQLTHALAKGEWAKAHSVQSRLAERASYAGDVTVLTIRSAETARLLEQWDAALARLKTALDLTPDHVVALSLWATWQLQRGDTSAAADGFEQLAQACADPRHRESSLSRAAELWLSVGDDSRAEFALEQLLTT